MNLLATFCRNIPKCVYTRLSFSPSLLQPSPFGIRLFHGGFPFVSLPSSFLLLPPLSTHPLIRCTQASRSFLLLPPRRSYVPHSCGIAPGWPTFYNPVPISWGGGGADLRRCSPTLYNTKTLFVTSPFVVIPSTRVYP